MLPRVCHLSRVFLSHPHTTQGLMVTFTCHNVLTSIYQALLSHPGRVWPGHPSHAKLSQTSSFIVWKREACLSYPKPLLSPETTLGLDDSLNFENPAVFVMLVHHGGKNTSHISQRWRIGVASRGGQVQASRSTFQ